MKKFPVWKELINNPQGFQGTPRPNNPNPKANNNPIIFLSKGKLLTGNSKEPLFQGPLERSFNQIPMPTALRSIGTVKKPWKGMLP